MIKVGNKVFIRTVTMYYAGKIESIGDGWIVLEPGALWVADSGDFGRAIRDGPSSFATYCVFPEPVAVAIGSIVDLTLFDFELPTS